MFEDFFEQLRSLNGSHVSVPIEADQKGYIDKQCPAEQCQFLFKVNQEDWANLFKDEAVWCPMCRHEAPADQWFTLEQVRHARSEAIEIAKGKIDKALQIGAKKFNRKQPRNSFLSVSVKVHGRQRRTYAFPAKAADAMQLEIKCDDCSARFAVIGSAYFCPACGANSVVRTYQDSLRKIRAKKDSEEIFRQALTQAAGKDEAELACRSIRETCLSDGVTAFQKFCEGLFEPLGKSPFNVFQRIDEGSELWRSVVGRGYDFWLSADELSNLKILFQKRHVLIHNEGIIDERYIEKSGDSTYKSGQRLVVSKQDIEILLSLLEKLGSGLGAAQDHK